MVRRGSRILDDVRITISKAEQHAGLLLEPNETFVSLMRCWHPRESAFSWVAPPLLPGATDRCVNVATGLPTPYDILAGYDFIVFQMLCNRDQHSEVRISIDDEFGIPAETDSLAVDINQPAVLTSIAFFDPLFDDPHTYDNEIENLGVRPMRGEEWQLCILRAMGTEPLPKKKIVRCKWCGETKEVPKTVMRVKCKICKEVTMYMDVNPISRLI